MTTDTGITLKELGNNAMFKVERKPANQKARWYEVLLSPFKTLEEANDYIKKYEIVYPTEDRNYRIVKI